MVYIKAVLYKSSPKLEASQMFFNGRLSTQKEVYSHSGLSFVKKKMSCQYVDESQNLYNNIRI